MALKLPPLEPAELAEGLSAALGRDLGSEVNARLFVHYQELRLWSQRFNLVGPGAANELIARHYAESLAPLRWLEARSSAGQNLVDIGSGAGFPGLLLAAALPELDPVLFESRGKKASFLRAAARRMGLSVEVVAERIGPTLPARLPARIDFLTLRAVRLTEPTWRRLAERIDAQSRVVLWTTEIPTELGRWLEVEETIASGRRRKLVLLRTKNHKERKASR